MEYYGRADVLWFTLGPLLLMIPWVAWPTAAILALMTYVGVHLTRQGRA